MPIIMRTDSDNIQHQIWAQEQGCSCSVASIWMARNQALQKTVNQDEWTLAWHIYGRVVQGMDLVPTAPMSFNPKVHPADDKTFANKWASAGIGLDQVVPALKESGLSVKMKTMWSTPGIASVIPQLLSDTTPAIVLLGWYGSGHRNGGHVIVASRATKSGRVVFLDPWEGQLRELGPGPAYPDGGRFEQIVYVSAK